MPTTMDEYKKLDQAFLDIADQETIPVAITRRKGCRTVYATLLLGDLVIMAGGNRKQCGAPGLRVSIHLDEFIAMVKKLQDQRDALVDDRQLELPALTFSGNIDGDS